jgi:phage gpG-like protein
LIRVTLTGAAQAIAGLQQVQQKMADALNDALSKEAQRLAAYMRDQVGANGPPLASNTLLTGGKDPLRRTLELQRTVSATEVRRLTWFIGVPRGANRHKIAAVHEFGTVITMQITAKQARWMAMNLPPPSGASGSAPGTLVIVIPARPYVRPTFAEAERSAQSGILAHLSARLQRTFR